MQPMKWRSVMRRPPVNTNIFFHVNEDVDDVVLEDGVDHVVEDMKRGSRYIARYKLVAGLVAEGKITGWIDEKKIFEVLIKDHTFDIWWEQTPLRPLGIATWNTSAALRNFQLIKLKPLAQQP